MSMDKFYLSVPHLAGGEEEYLGEALGANGVVPADSNVVALESEFCKYLGGGYAAGVASGTSALHLLLIALGIGKGDHVFCSTLTFAGSANPICYTGATPVFIDSEPDSLNMSSVALKRALKNIRPKAIIAVNLFGESADYHKLFSAKNKYSRDSIIIEDAAESLGATYRGFPSGTLGDVSFFSFNTNKIITTGGGGMAFAKDEALIEKIRMLSSQAKDSDFYYLHSMLGYNYRMNSVGAGVGRAQLASLAERIKKKRKIHKWYEEAIARADAPFSLKETCAYGEPNFWMNQIYYDHEVDTEKVTAFSLESGIELRGIWRPMHKQPFYQACEYFTDGERDFAGEVYRRGLCLPSDIELTQGDVEKIVDALASTRF